MTHCPERGERIPEPNASSTIDRKFRPATPSSQMTNDRADVLRNGLSKIEDEISGKPGDPGKLYPLHERVRRVIGALQGKIGALESRGRR